MSREQIAELDRRLGAHRRDPGQVTTWEAIQQRILGGRSAVNELVFLLSADAGIQAAHDFYEEFQAGRGEVFIRRLDVALGRLRAFPESAPVFAEPYRRLLVHGFPVGIFYTFVSRLHFPRFRSGLPLGGGRRFRSAQKVCEQGQTPLAAGV